MTIRLASIAFSLAVACGASLTSADTLQDIYELALNNDATLKAAEATYRANLETENIARAALLPQVAGNASYSDSEVDTESFGITSVAPTVTYGTTEGSRDTEGESYSLSLTQKIFDLPAWFTFRSGKETSKQAAAQFAADQQDVIIRVAEAYFNVLRAQENLEAVQAEERAAKRQLEQTQQRFDVGLIAITDVHESRAVYDNTQAQRLAFEANLGTAYEALSVLTGRAQSNLWRLNKDFPITSPEPDDRSEWVQFALENNYDLKAAMFAMEAARQQATSQRMEHLPKIKGAVGYSEEDTDGTSRSPNPLSPDTIDDHSEATVWSVELNVPLFAGGGISAARRQAYEQYNAVLQQKINTQRTVVQQTRSLHLTVATDVQRVKARRQSIVSAQSALDATKAGYEVGTRNVVDVLQAQRSLYAAIRDYANARYDYVINMLQLKRQAGTLSPKDIYDLNHWLIEPPAVTATQSTLH